MLDAPCRTTNKTGTQLHPLAERLPKIILSSQTPQNTTRRGPAHQKDKTQAHPPEHRHQSHPPGSLHKPLNQTLPLQADTENNGNYEYAAWEKETPNTVSWTKWEDREICRRWRSKVKTHLTKKNEEEKSSLPEKEFRVMIVKMIQNLGNRMEKNAGNV